MAILSFINRDVSASLCVCKVGIKCYNSGDTQSSIATKDVHVRKPCVHILQLISTVTRLEPNMLKNLPIISS